MNIGERIKYLRKDVLKITQDELSEKIGIKRSGLSLLEIGRNNPTDQTIRSICREFDISERWLRYGEGDMRVILTRDEELARLMAEAQTDPPDTLRIRLLSAMARLNEDDWEVLARIAEKIVKE